MQKLQNCHHSRTTLFSTAHGEPDLYAKLVATPQRTTAFPIEIVSIVRTLVFVCLSVLFFQTEVPEWTLE
jgi:hypothetical protein